MNPGTVVRTLLVGVVAAALSLLLLPHSAEAQSGAISGQVVDAASERPLPFAQVLVVGTGIGAITDSEGQYRLTDVPAGPATVRVTLIGYTRSEQEVTVVAEEVVTADFQLRTTAIALDELVVTGQAGAVARRELATTVDIISAADIDRAAVTSIDQLLQGRVAGGTVSTVSAQPGTAGLINFRGVSSVFGSQTPVIYVDGVRIDNSDQASAWSGGEFSSALAEVMVADIERVEITKGGAASTLFGADAATGVIQIFTKRGEAATPRVNLRVDQGFDTPELKYILDAEVIYPELVAEGTDPRFLRNNYFRTGHFQSYSASASGGSADLTFSVSGRAQHGDGVQPKNQGSVFNLRGALNTRASDRLSLDFSGLYIRNSFDRLYNGTAIADPLTAMEVGDAMFFSGTDNLQDALDVFLMPEIDEGVNRFILSSGADYVPSEAISARASVGIDYRKNQQRIFQPVGFTAGEDTGQLERFDREFLSLNMQASATYAYPREGPITSRLTVGAQASRDTESIMEAQGRVLPPGSPDFDMGGEITASEFNRELFGGGLFIQERVGFHDRLFLEAGLRVDGHTAFGDDVDFKAFPKFGLTYLPSDERFWQESVGRVFNEMKLRVAYGETGKPPPPFLRDRSFSSVPFRGEAATRFENPGNLELEPEVTATLEAGFDASLLDNRVGINFTWFDARTRDALFFVPEQPATGQGTQLRNVGKIENRGIEVDASARVLDTRDLSWTLSGTFQTVSNEVTDMGGLPPFAIAGTGAQQWVEEGHAVGAWQVTMPVDTNGDGRFDGSVRDYTGTQPWPTRSGSVSTDITLFDRLSLFGLADWAAGHEVFDWGSVWSTFNGIFRREIVEDDFVFPIRHDLDGNEVGPYFQSAARSAFLVPGRYWKLRELSASYQVPGDFAQRLGFSRARVTASVRNLAIFSATGMVDPELAGVRSTADLTLGGETSITLPAPRQFRLGVDVSF